MLMMRVRVVALLMFDSHFQQLVDFLCLSYVVLSQFSLHNIILASLL